MNGRSTQSAAGGSRFAASPYARPLTTGVVESTSTMIWKDFLYAVKKRKALINKLKEAASDNNTAVSNLKRLLLEVRQITLDIIEDALEIEYKSRVQNSNQNVNNLRKGSRQTGRLPPITSYKIMEEKEDLMALNEIIYDVDQLFSIPNIRVMLPMSFPSTRNPFLLGKSIDELATIIPPHPEAGNVEEELKVLELLRYKRASKALLRGEAQIQNRFPIDLYEIEKLFIKLVDDINIEKLIRCICTIIDNDLPNHHGDPILTYLLIPIFNMEGYEFLNKFNLFRGAQPLRIDIQFAINQKLKECNFSHLQDDMTVSFFLEWLGTVLNQPNLNSKPSSSVKSVGLGSLSKPNSSQVRMNSPSKLNNLAEDSFRTNPNLKSHMALPGVGQSLAYQSINIPTNAPNEFDMASEVGSQGFDKTHENMYVEKPPSRKLYSRGSVERSVQQNSVEIQADNPDWNDLASPVLKESATSPNFKPNQMLASPQQFTNKHKEKVKKKKEKSETIQKKIRAEVEKAMRTMSFHKRTGEDDDAHPSNNGFDTLSSVRYELNKIQQELLRKQVLDPRYYNISSVDATSHAQRGISVANVNSFDPFERKYPVVDGKHPAPLSLTASSPAALGTMTSSSIPVDLAEKKITVSINGVNTTIYLTISFHAETCGLYCSINIQHDEAVKCKFVKSIPLYSLEKDTSLVCLAHFEISSLLFTKIAEDTIPNLLQAAPDMKNRLLMNIFEMLEQLVRSSPFPRGKIIAPVNRVLFENRFSEDHILVDLIVLRNTDCDGLVIQCTPIAGLTHSRSNSTNIGPVILHISDSELEVLMIGQHGLYDKAKERWKAMETVAQWVSARLQVRRIITSASDFLAENHQDTKQPALIEDDNFSVNSQITLTARANDNQGGALSTEVLENPINLQASQTIARPNTSHHNLLMMEVKLDRRIEISKTLFEHWKSRNIPRIMGLETNLSLVQDLEVMIIDLTLTLPNKRAFKKLQQEIKSNEGEDGDLLDLANYSDDEDYDAKDSTPTIIHYTYRLTLGELLTFGSSEMIEQKKITMSKNMSEVLEEGHPESMLWNILSRLKVAFKGNRSNPYKSSTTAADMNNWELKFDRQLMRDVRTITKHVLMITVSGVGGELVLEPQYVDSSKKKKINKKVVTEAEISELIASEGLPYHLSDYKERKSLIPILLDKLKVVMIEQDEYYLELYTFVESKMLTVTRIATSPDEMEQELGSIEINSHHTLSDLRVMMKHELDQDELPIQFRFMYKGTICSIRQETFRRAWECLPCCYISPKIIATNEISIETDDIIQKRQNKNAQKVNDQKVKIPKLLKGQRRMPGKYLPFPVNSLCIVQEGSKYIYLLNEATELFVPGDVIRIGSVQGRDYIVTSIGVQQIDDDASATSGPGGGKVNLKVITIDPEYDLISEPEFNVPLSTNFPYPKSEVNAFFTKDDGSKVKLLKNFEDMGYSYDLPQDYLDFVTYQKKKKEESEARKALLKGPKKVSALLATLESASFDYQTESKDFDNTIFSAPNDSNLLGETIGTNNNPTSPVPHLSIGAQDSLLLSALGKSSAPVVNSISRFTKKGSRLFFDCWIWKCLPLKEDPRPKFKQLYDAGDVFYPYEFVSADDRSKVIEYFRIPISFAYMEIICNDSRCSYLTYFSQRVQEMHKIPIDFYTKLIFDKMTDWSPIYKRGIERIKFIKLIRDVQAFPDLKKPARLAQIDMLFQRIVKSENGIVQKYINYIGFCQLIKELALVRFPYTKAKQKEGEANSQINDKNSESASQQTKDEDKISPLKKLKGHGHYNPNARRSSKSGANAGYDDSSVMTDDLSSIGSDGDDLSINSNSQVPKVPRHRPRKSSRALNSIKGNKTNDDKDKDNNKESGSYLDRIDGEYVNFAYQKFILDYLMMFERWYDIPWKEAKIATIKKEAVRYCAATRIIARYRAFHQSKLYQNFLRQHIILQAHIRRKLAVRRVRAIWRVILEDWIFQYRYKASIKIQALIRRFIKRCWYYHVLIGIKRQQYLLLKARRLKLKKLKDMKRKTVLYTEAKVMNSVMVIVKVQRKDSRNYTKDYGILIEVYIPISQETFHFAVEDGELRYYMYLLLYEQHLSVSDGTEPEDGPGSKAKAVVQPSSKNSNDMKAKLSLITVGDLMDKRNLKRLIVSRLIVHNNRGSKPSVIFSKHALGQKGVRSMTRGIRVQGQYFVAKIFETVEEISIQLYHPLTSKIFICAISMKDLKDWVMQEHHLNVVSDLNKRLKTPSNSRPTTPSIERTDSNVKEEAVREIPIILQPKEKASLNKWLLEHIMINSRQGKFQPMFKCHYEKRHKKAMIIKIQAQWRRALVRPIIIAKLDQFMLKVHVGPSDFTVYYLNRLTGASSWGKPRLLGKYDLPTIPSRRWVPIQYEYEGLTYFQYVNPYTGQYTQYTVDQAVRMIQALARNYLLKTLRMPLVNFSKAGKLYKSARNLYYSAAKANHTQFLLEDQTPASPSASTDLANINNKRLAQVVNYALTLHIVECDEEQAKEVYREAVELSESNPLVTRAYAFFLLGTCEAPIQLNRERAMLLLSDAKRKDPTHHKFQLAYYLCQFACIRSPNNYKTLVNLALVQCILYDLNYTAEKLLRRALALAPMEQRVMEIWKYLKDRFPERHMIYNPHSRIHKNRQLMLQANSDRQTQKGRVIHGRPVIENPQWAGWVFVEKDTFNVSKQFKDKPYWYNPVDGMEALDPPDFAKEWEVRKYRSYFEEEKYGLETYYDPLTSEYFQYHPLTNSYA